MMIFHLSRSGYGHYAAGMIQQLPGEDWVIFLSKYRSLDIQRPFRELRTYRNWLEFFLNSLIILPLFLLEIYRIDKKFPQRSAWFSGFHYWDLPLLLLCKSLKIRTFYTVHDSTLHEGENRWHHRLLQNACIRRADEIICLSEYVAHDLRQKWRTAAPVTVIPHGIISLPKLASRRAHRDRLRLLFLGRIGKYKGVEQLVEAVNLSGEGTVEHLTIAGKPLYPLRIEPSVKIRLRLGRLPDEELVELLNSHDLLVLPYLSATQSGVVALGIAAAIPMICTRVGALPEQLADNEAVWSSAEPQALADAIRSVSKNPALFEALHERLKAKRDALSREGIARQLHRRMSRNISIPSQ